MTNLAERSTVIPMDGQLDIEDITFCEKQQAAYDASREGFQRLAELLDEVRKDQYDLLGDLDKEFRNPYMENDVFSYGYFYAKLHRGQDERSRAFVTTIVQYFCKKYHVDLNEVAIYVRLVTRWNIEVRRKDWSGFEQMVKDHPMRYEDIVREIFVETDGQTFKERAVAELTERSQEAGQLTEIRRDMITVRKAVDVCTHKSGIEYRGTDRLRAILDAIIYFATGEIGAGSLYFPELFSCETEDVVFYPDVTKVSAIKLYKNGNARIRFYDNETARRFAMEFLLLDTGVKG